MARRWVCPNCGGGINGPDRPRRDDVRRYCLDCSRETGRLVERVSPALERQRQEGAARTARKQQAKRQRESLGKIAAVSAPLYVDGKLRSVRIDHLVDRAWKLPSRKREAPGLEYPLLTVRRGLKPEASGRCWYGNRIILTMGRHDLAHAIGLVLHEVAHAITDGTGRRRPGDHHGSLFRSINRNLVSEWTGVPMADQGGTSREFYMATIDHLRKHPADG